MADEVPVLLVTETFKAPTDAAGLMAVIVPSVLIVNELAGVEPNRTPVAPANSVPEMTTVVPPVTDPDEALIAVTLGGGTTNANLSATEMGDAPLDDWRVTSTVPNASAGAIAVIDVGLVAMKLVAGTVPNNTAVTLDMFVPTIATGVPPVV